MIEGNSSESKLSQYIRPPTGSCGMPRTCTRAAWPGSPARRSVAPSSRCLRAYGFGLCSRTSSSEEEINDLIGAGCKSKMRAIPVEDGTPVPRSHSVATLRIDEDKPCDFEDDLTVALGPRSCGYDVATERKVGF